MQQRLWVIATSLAGFLAGCDSGAPAAISEAREKLELSYIMAFKDEAGAKKCLQPKQLDGGRWFSLCGFNEGGGTLRQAALWELREDSGTWAAYAANGTAMTAQPRLGAPQIKPAEAPPKFDVGKARAMFPQ
jgi:hypothetical protein